MFDAIKATTLLPQMSFDRFADASDASAAIGAFGNSQNSLRYSCTRSDCSPEPPRSVTSARSVKASAIASAPMLNVLPPKPRDAIQSVTGVFAKNASENAANGFECPLQTDVHGNRMPSVFARKALSSSSVLGLGIDNWDWIADDWWSSSGSHRRKVSSSNKFCKFGRDRPPDGVPYLSVCDVLI